MFGIGNTRSRYKAIEYTDGRFDLIHMWQRKGFFGWETTHENIVNHGYYFKSMEEIQKTIETFRRMKIGNEIKREVYIDE